MTTKPIQIAEDKHRKLKVYCAKNGVKMKPLIEQYIEDLTRGVHYEKKQIQHTANGCLDSLAGS
jgi:hypothetical protein